MTAPARLQAPRQDGAMLAEPPFRAVGDLLARNRERLEQAKVFVLDRPLSELRRLAQAQILRAAEQYLHAAGEPIPTFSRQPRSLLLSGHQPELFHPGVWIKNFALHQLAQTHGAVPLNLIVDTDQAKSADLKVPTWGGPDPEKVQRLTVPFDRWTRDVPYEERRVLDESLFASLPERLAPIFRAWPFPPMLPAFWAEMLQQAPHTDLLGERFVRARRSWERRWGCHNWEVPVSRLCQTDAFTWFACHLLLEAPRFHALYNACVLAYRERYGIRNRMHPVPDLATEGDWLEMPFWGWRQESARRGRLLVRAQGDTLALRLGDEDGPSLPRGSPEKLTAAWTALEHAGIKIRTRALTTTLFARLLLGDLFIHGIGGAKYDEITDALLQRFFGLEPPEYLVVSATLRLPFPAFAAHADDCRHLQHELRDCLTNPQRHLDAVINPQAAALGATKRDWIARQPANGRERRQRFETLRELTQQLRPFLTDNVQERQRRLQTCRQQVDANAILQRRDYAFCLYPEEMLRKVLSS